jgi:hypothetical protein
MRVRIADTLGLPAQAKVEIELLKLLASRSPWSITEVYRLAIKQASFDPFLIQLLVDLVLHFLGAQVICIREDFVKKLFDTYGVDVCFGQL